MFRMLLIPNWTEKPTAPSAITAPDAIPKPMASMSRLNRPAYPTSAKQSDDLAAGDLADFARAAVGGENVSVEFARRVVVGVKRGLAQHADVLDLLAGLQRGSAVGEVANHCGAGLWLDHIED